MRRTGRAGPVQRTRRRGDAFVAPLVKGGWLIEREIERKRHRDEGKKEEHDDEENKIKCRTEAFRISSSDLTRKWKKPGTVDEETRDGIKFESSYLNFVRACARK